MTAVTKVSFGKTKDGKEANLYKLKNSKGTEAVVTDFGAILVNLFVKNDKGEVKDVVLGFDTLPEYEKNGSFFGSTIGPSANRIANGKCVIDGKEYQLKVNCDDNNLHSDYDIGFHKQLWSGEIVDNGVKFSYEYPDGLVGLPGNMKVSVTYTLSEDNELKLEYEGVADKTTIFNLTNHSYFNLAGHDAGDKGSLSTELTFNASKFTDVIDSQAIPTGNLTDVKGTPLDFTSPKTIGERIKDDYEQLKFVNGYDHNFAIDNYDGTLRKFAVARNDGRTMEVYTDLPGFQFYSGNWVKENGKQGVTYKERSGFCIETQYFPNSANDSHFLSPIKKAGEKYHTVTIYKFL